MKLLKYMKYRKKTKSKRYVTEVGICRLRRNAWSEGYDKGKKDGRNELISTIINLLGLDDRYEGNKG